MNTVIEVFDHCRAHAAGLDVAALQAQVASALPLCLAEVVEEAAPLGALAEIELTLVDDAEIGRVHGEFMEDPTPTDVITFRHGEILLSVDTALRQGHAHGNSLQRELLLYAIHGLLHLAGHQDATAEGADRMREVQERLLEQILPQSA